MGKGNLYHVTHAILEGRTRKAQSRTSENEIAKEINMANRDQFSGDMSRNEVEIDLSKFMEMVTENNELKQKIWELEHDDKKNPWQKWVFAAKTLDAWRIWPRAFLSVYIFLIYYVVMWFLDLESPTIEQSGLISILVGAGAAWFGLYVNSAAKEHDSDNQKK